VFCGLQMRQFKTGLLIHQRTYIRNLLNDRGYSNARLAPTPAVDQDPQPAPANHPLRQWPLRKLCGELVWPASQTQPHIAHAVHKACIYMHRLPDVCYPLISRIYRNLQDERGLFFPANVNPAALELLSFADAALGHCKFTKRSSHGEVHLLTGPVAWAAQRQSTVATSTQDSETISMSAAARTAISIQNFLGEVGAPIQLPSILYGDNQGSVLSAQNGMGSNRSRHLVLRHHYLVEQVRSRKLSPRKVTSASNLADTLTKGVAAPAYRRLMDQYTVKLSDFLANDEDFATAPPVSEPTSEAVLQQRGDRKSKPAK